jgi:tetratricopeptide (TPR) repeat protein
LGEAKRRGISSVGLSAGLGLVAFTNKRWQKAESHLWDAIESPTKEMVFGFEHYMQWFTLVTIAIGNQPSRSDEARLNENLVLYRWRHPWVQNMIGWSLVERAERLDDAAGMLEKAVNAEPGNAAYLDSLGWANFKLQKFDIGEDQLERAVELSGGRPEILEHLAEVYAATDRLVVAREALTSAISRTTNGADRERLTARLQKLK